MNPDRIFTKIIKSQEDKILIFRNKEERENYHNETYQIFKKENFKSVVERCDKIKKNDLSPKFDFIKSISNLETSKDTAVNKKNCNA